MRPMSLAAARVDAKMTQDDVAKAMHVTKATIVAWEKGKTQPKIAQAQELCKLYDRGIDEIFLSVESSEN